MPLGEALRAELRARVGEAREILVEDLGRALEGRFGVHREGRFEGLATLPEVQGDPRRTETRELLHRLLAPLPKTKGEREAFAEAYDRLLRGIAFTHLNRLVAFKLMEHPSRKLIRETVGPQRDVRGFAHFRAEDAEAERLWNAGNRGRAYERFLLHRSAEWHEQVGVLFDPDDLASRIFPGTQALEKVLAILNEPALNEVWADPETLGWVYQYYTPKSLRDRARKASAAPRNAWEMAFRNQFFTPRYVVQFLADNTLGRLWVSMKPDSALRERCASLLVRPGEKFEPREKKDPRHILVIDPACGSGHFLLYAFDLFEVIYAEAWEDPDLGPALHADFGDRDAFVREVPRLVVEHNLHGVDIDRRAAQIAALSLYLRARASSNAVSITTSHVVCGEPLGGTAELRDDFKARKLGGTGSTQARIFDAVVEKLALAGEAGTLLRLEEEIGRAIHDEKVRWQAQVAAGAQGSLFPGLGDGGGQLDFSDVTDERFWGRVEKAIVHALREYATEAEGAEGAQRRIFAGDGAEALRFIDVLRKRYDVVLMNPPFGKATPRTKPYVDARYGSSRQDLAACFVERAFGLAPRGYVGAITAEALFFRRTLEAFRRRVLLERSTMEVMAHLGDNVLDTAKVRVAAYALEIRRTAPGPSLFIRALEESTRLKAISGAIASHRMGGESGVYIADQREFDALPYSVFGYWCGSPVRAVFSCQPALEGGTGAVRVGLQTSDDLRFLRLRWESKPEPSSLLAFAKGGDFSPYHDDVHLRLSWAREGIEVFSWARSKPQNIGWFGFSGLTYPRRTNKRFAPRVFPKGCAFADKGPAVFLQPDSPRRRLALLGLLNSRSAGYLLSLGTGMSEAKDISNSYEVGLVQRLPIPETAVSDSELASAALAAVSARRGLDIWDESMAAFVLPFPVPPSRTLDACAAAVRAQHAEAARQYEDVQKFIDARSAHHYGFGPAEVAELDAHVGPIHTLSVPKLADAKRTLAERLISWAVGVTLGRFDLRLATGARPIPALGDPWDPVPAFSPGMLPDGKVPAEYPATVAEEGILVDDLGHSWDLVHAVMRPLRAVWGDDADGIVDEAMALLRAGDLRSYLTRPGANGFWTAHVKRYSRSKRRAPIYWLLRSPKGFYSAYLYAHRLDRDTLFLLLGHKYLGGKIDRVQHDVAELRQAMQGGSRTRAQEQRVESLEDELADLEEFRKALERVTQLRNDRDEAAPYAPDLADGVVLAAAPLHELIPWPDTKDLDGNDVSELVFYWRKLADGAYPWSKVAMHYWPEATLAACRKDASVAIAHGNDAEFFPGLRAELAARAAKAAAGEEAETEADDDAEDGDEEDDEENDA